MSVEQVGFSHIKIYQQKNVSQWVTVSDAIFFLVSISEGNGLNRSKIGNTIILQSFDWLNNNGATEIPKSIFFVLLFPFKRLKVTR